MWASWRSFSRCHSTPSPMFDHFPIKVAILEYSPFLDTPKSFGPLLANVMIIHYSSSTMLYVPQFQHLSEIRCPYLGTLNASFDAPKSVVLPIGFMWNGQQASATAQSWVASKACISARKAQMDQFAALTLQKRSMKWLNDALGIHEFPKYLGTHDVEYIS